MSANEEAATEGVETVPSLQQRVRNLEELGKRQAARSARRYDQRGSQASHESQGVATPEPSPHMAAGQDQAQSASDTTEAAADAENRDRTVDVSGDQAETLSGEWGRLGALGGVSTSVQDVDLHAVLPAGCGHAAGLITSILEAHQVPAGVTLGLMMAVAGFATAGATILAGAGGHREMPMIWMLAFRKAGRRKTMLQRLLVESVEPSLRAGAERSPVMDEATYAGLRVMMASTMGRAMIASAEGDSIDNVTDGRSMSGLLLRGYFGERLAAVRSGDTGSDIPCAMVGMAIQAQLQRVDRLVGNSRHEISGLLDRMLITVHPDEELPPVYGTTEAIDETELAWWRDRIAEIGAEPRHAMVGEMRPVQANEQAIAALHAWDLRTRQDAEAGGIWSRHPGLLAKGVGHVLRIAGALRLLRDAVQAEIEACDVEAASEYMDWIVLHREALRPLTATGRHDVDLAHKLVVWVGGRRLVRFGASEAVQALRCAAAQRVEDWTPVFNLLVSAGYLRPDLIQPSGPRGGRPVRGFLVHPTLRGADA